MAEKKEEKLDVEETKEETKKSNKILVTVLIIVLMVACGFGGWLIGAAKVATDCIEVNQDAKETFEKTNKEKTEETTKDETTKDTTTTTDTTNCEPETVVETAKPKCYGTYTVDGTEGSEKWILKDDGTWKVEGKEQFGVFYITGNTITFVEMNHTTGPEEASYHSPKSYYINDDCSKVRFTAPGTEISAGMTKQK